MEPKKGAGRKTNAARADDGVSGGGENMHGHETRGVGDGAHAGGCRKHHCNEGSGSLPNACERSGFGPDRGTAGAEEPSNYGRPRTTQGHVRAYARNCKSKSMSRQNRRARWLENGKVHSWELLEDAVRGAG